MIDETAAPVSRVRWDLAPAAAGVVTMLVTPVLIAEVRNQFGLALHLVFVCFVPVGALACGALAASGCYAGAQLSGRRPGRFAIAAMVASSAAAYAGIFAVGYLIDDAGRRQNADALPVHDFLASQLRSATILIPSLRTGALALFAYPLGLVAWAGFAIGSGFVASVMVARLHCPHCKGYLRAVVSASTNGTREDVVRKFEEAHQLVRAGRACHAMALVRESSPVEAGWKLTLEHSTCARCGREHTRLRISTRRRGRPPAPVSSTAVLLRFYQ